MNPNVCFHLFLINKSTQFTKYINLYSNLLLDWAGGSQYKDSYVSENLLPQYMYVCILYVGISLYV